jgi:peptide chain release factor 2
MLAISELKSSLESIKNKLDLPKLVQQANDLESQTLAEGFWDHKNSGQVASELGSLQAQIKLVEDFEQQINEFLEFCQLDPNFQDSPEAQADLQKLMQLHDQLVLESTLSGKYDKLSAILSVHSGAGGDDAQDFANMLADMYKNYAQLQGWQATLVDADYTAAGIKHITLQIQGTYAYGNLKAEHGVHRLVRLSPFNSGGTRETSFAMVSVIPELKQDNSFQLNPDDLKVDTFKSSGPGGQSVNTTDSAVRVTHIPTGIQAASQSERSQHQNKENAMTMLQSKLLHLQQEQQAHTIEEIRGDKTAVSFGSQIRSYTLHPYKLVKDHRTKHESNHPEQVFAGEIQDFIDSFLLT